MGTRFQSLRHPRSPAPPLLRSSAPPRLVTARVSSLPTDDLVVVDPAKAQLHLVVTDESPRAMARQELLGAPWSVALDVEGGPVAVLPMRLNVDALSDLVVFKSGPSPLTVALTAPVHTFTVNDTGDAGDPYGDDNKCDTENNPTTDPPTPPSDICTLRAAIEQANDSDGADQIEFNLGTGTPTISPGSFLPPIRETITILGNTGDATRVELDGSNAGNNPGLSTTNNTSNSRVYRMVINRFKGPYLGDGFYLNGMGIALAGNNNIVEGNYLGTDANGTSPEGNGGTGVLIPPGSSGNIIGGSAEAARNVISGNGGGEPQGYGHGVVIGSPYGGAPDNVVIGNYIGTDATGSAALGNDGVGVVVYGSNNKIGGNTLGAGNLISDNGGDGVVLQDANTTGNQVLGNYIGTDAYGLVALGSGWAGGVVILDGARDNTIGGNTAAARNLISGNGGNGVSLRDAGTTGNQVLGNYIGTDAYGMGKLGNGLDGVVIRDDASNNTIGGDTPGARNFISGNDRSGVLLQGAETISNTVLGNYIGTNISGTVKLGNGWAGVRILGGGRYNTIGGDTRTSPGARNLISGNQSGVWLEGVETISNTVLGNFIGTDAAGTGDLGNAGAGVVILGGAKNNTIGGNTEGARNLISGNDGDGVWLDGADTISNTVQGNYIGTNISGTVAISNTGSGVRIEDASRNSIGGLGGVTPGGDCTGECNIISGNGGDGVAISGASAISNTIRGNAIYDNGGLGINLVGDNDRPDGVTPNDTGGRNAPPPDDDSGPNDLMNFPVGVTYVSAQPVGGVITATISGVLPTTDPQLAVVDIYAIAAVNDSGFSNADDNCPAVFNPDQTDSDEDGIGDACSLETLTLDPVRVDGGAHATGTISLTLAAPSGGALVQLYSSDKAVATVPTSVTIPEGATAATFIVTTNPVTTSIPVTITAVYGVDLKEAVLTVEPCYDFNGSGAVDIEDIALIAAAWRATDAASLALYDFNGNGIVDIEDIMTAVTHWGETCL